MECDRCKSSIEGDVYEYRGERLCEDCYIDALNPPKACDPWAVHSAKSTVSGKNVMEHLTPRQARLVQFLRERGQASAEEIAGALGMGEAELKREVATLRHMEVVKAAKRGSEIVFTLFDRAKERGAGSQGSQCS